MDYIYKYPFFRISLFYCASIVFGGVFIISSDYDIVLFSLAICLLSFLSSFLYNRLVRFGLIWIWGVLSLLLLCGLGIIQNQLVNDKRSGSHWQNVVNERPSGVFLIELNERPVLKRDNFRFAAEVLAVKIDSDFIPTHGRVLVYIQVNDLKGIQLDYKSRLLVESFTKDLMGPVNPFGFSPKEYFGNQSIYRSMRLGPRNWIYVGSGELEWYMDWANRASDYLALRFKSGGLTGREYSVATALVFGLRNEMDMEVISAFASSGAMHILSVSGMHVGMIFLALQFLLKLLDRSNWSRVIKSIFIILVLWAYSLVSGLTPSVLRSSLMLSFIVFGELIGRRQHPVNTLFMVAFFLLLYDIRLFWNVGFQLSFVAVLGILLWYKKLYGMVFFRWKFLDWIWSVSAVSVVATLATLPLCFFYFHQFPNYFLLSNYLVIPVSNLVIYLGIALSVFGIFPVFSYWIGKALYWSVWMLNELVFAIERLPGAVTTGIVWSIFDLVLFYLMLFGLLFALNKSKARAMLLLLFCFWVICVGNLFLFYRNFQTSKLAFYKGKGDLIQGILKGNEIVVMREDGEESIRRELLGSMELVAAGNSVLRSRMEKDNSGNKQKSGYHLYRIAGKLVCFMWGKCTIKDAMPPEIDILYLQNSAYIKGWENLRVEGLDLVVLGNGISKKKAAYLEQIMKLRRVKILNLAEGGKVVSFQ